MREELIERPLKDYDAEDFFETVADLYARLTGRRFARTAVWTHADIWLADFPIPLLINQVVLWLTDKNADHDPKRFGDVFEYERQAKRLWTLAKKAARPKTYVPHPSCPARVHIDGAAFKVYDFASALSRKSGECWLSKRTTARFCGLSDDTTRLALTSLIAHGWLEIIKAPKAGRSGAGRYRVVGHAEWAERNNFAGCILTEAEEYGPKSDPLQDKINGSKSDPLET